jgi:hypothetical protein
MFAEDMPAELRRKLPHDIRLYMRNYWQFPNDPTRSYDFYDDVGPKKGPDDEEGNFLYYLADDEGPLNPDEWADINVLLFCRGGLKTTVATAAVEWAVANYPFIEADVTAPRQEQFSEVMDRFKSHIKTSGLAQLRTKNNVSHQKFERKIEEDSGEVNHVEADVKARSAWGDGDALRGLHGQIGVIDEFQDVDEGMFSTFLEAIDQSVPDVDYFPTIFVIGTPKMANSFFHELWQMSDQKDWTPNEESQNGSWVSQSEPEEFIPTEMAEQRQEYRDEAAELISYLHEEARSQYESAQKSSDSSLSDFTNETIDYLCDEIKSNLSKAAAIEGYSISGWHIDQYASPVHDDTKIEFKKQKYTKKKFKNEVLAQFYSPENDLLNDSHVEEAFQPDKGFKQRRQYEDSTVSVGVDWGGGSGPQASDTVIAVGETYEEGDQMVTDVLNVDFIDSDANKQMEMDRVEQYIRDYEADRIAVDEGYGAKQREDLQDGNNIWKEEGWDKVCGVIYGNIKDKDRPKFSNTSFKDSAFCTVARTHMIEGMVAYFKNGSIRIPKSGLRFDRDGSGTKLKDQLTAPYTDRVETSDGKKKLKVQADRSDDAFHAMTYMWLAAHKFGSTRSLKTIHTQNRAGI